MNRTVRRAKQLARESGQSFLNLDQRINLLFHMRNHYKLLVSSSGCVDSRLRSDAPKIVSKKQRVSHAQKKSLNAFRRTAPLSGADGVEDDHFSTMMEAKLLAAEGGGVLDCLGTQIMAYFHMRNHIVRLLKTKPCVDCFNGLMEGRGRSSSPRGGSATTAIGGGGGGGTIKASVSRGLSQWGLSRSLAGTGLGSGTGLEKPPHPG